MVSFTGKCHQVSEAMICKLNFPLDVIILLLYTSSSFARGDAEEFHATVGVRFCQRVHSLAFLKDSTEDIDYQLVTEDKKTLFLNSWIKYKWATNEIYGFPLEGNEGVSIFYIKIISDGHLGYQEIRIYTSPSSNDFLHQVEVCTQVKTVNHLLNRLDTRYVLVEMLARVLMKTFPRNLHLRGFKGHCFTLSFANVDQGVKCNRDGIEKLKNRLFDSSEMSVSERFASEMSILIDVTSANLTLYGACVSKEHVGSGQKWAWLKSVAPAVVLATIIGIPVGIACYVGRNVQRRQNRMLQQQDRFLKVEEKRRIARAKEYQKGCGLDKASFDSGISEVPPDATHWKTSMDENIEGVIVFHKALDEYIPQVLLEKYKSRRRAKKQT